LRAPFEILSRAAPRGAFFDVDLAAAILRLGFGAFRADFFFAATFFFLLSRAPEKTEA